MQGLRSANKRMLAVATAIVLILGGYSSVVGQTSTAKKKKPVYYTVPAGETIRVRLNEELNSEEAQVGDEFTVTTVDPVYSSKGVLVVPQASTLVGKVTNIKRAGKNGEPATLDVQFVGLRLPNGMKRQINGSLADLSSSSSSSDDEGTVTARKTSKRNLKFIGGGAAGGGLIGAIAGGGKGFLIGAGVGAAAGLIGGRIMKGHEVKVESGTEFGVVLNRAIWLQKYRAAS
jgi:hypothetical protein